MEASSDALPHDRWRGPSGLAGRLRGIAWGIEKIVRSVARSRTEGETLHLTYTSFFSPGLVPWPASATGTSRHTRGALVVTQPQPALSRGRAVASMVSWLIAAKAKPPPLLCAVPSRSPARKGLVGTSGAPLLASRFPDQTVREQLGSSSRLFRRVMISRRSERQLAF